MENETNLSETRAETNENDLAGLLEERLRSFCRVVALDVYYTFLDYIPCSHEGDRVEGTIAQPARLNVWNATVVTFLKERERLGGHRKKMCKKIYAYYVTVADCKDVLVRLEGVEASKLYFAPVQFNSDSVIQ